MRQQVSQQYHPNDWLCAKVVQIKTLIVELGKERRTLLLDIQSIEDQSGIRDPYHYTYSPLAQALRARCDRLDQSIAVLTQRLENL